MKNLILLVITLGLTACGSIGGKKYQDIYDEYRAAGKTQTEAIKAADYYCLNNPCRWGSR